MDILSDILSLMKLEGTLYYRTSFNAPWGVDIPAFADVARFHYVHRGRCYAHVEGEAGSTLLEQGDLIIIAHGAAHRLSDPSDVKSLSVDEVKERSGFRGRGVLVHGEPGAGHETQLICGHFSFNEESRHILVDALPSSIHIKDYGKDSPDWLDNTLKIIGGEAAQDRLGSDLIGIKLSEIIFTQALRHYLDHDGKTRKGFAGFTDNHIRLALGAIHREPDKNWTVQSLADVAGLSRTAFANRFSNLVSYTPLNYLTAWRMQLARTLLADTDMPIIEVACRTGYQSEASFGRVFKRHFDIPPAGYRRGKTQAAGLSRDGSAPIADASDTRGFD